MVKRNQDDIISLAESLDMQIRIAKSMVPVSNNEVQKIEESVINFILSAAEKVNEVQKSVKRSKTLNKKQGK